MKIILTSCAQGNGTITVGDDDGGEYIRDFRPEQSREVQREDLPRSPYKTFLERDNADNKFTWTVDYTFATQSDCDAFVLTHGDAVPVKCNVEFRSDLATRWLKGAMVDRVQCVEHCGVSCAFSYSVSGAQLLNSRPTTL